MWQIQEYKSCTKYTHDTGSFHEKNIPNMDKKYSQLPPPLSWFFKYSVLSISKNLQGLKVTWIFIHFNLCYFFLSPHNFIGRGNSHITFRVGYIISPVWCQQSDIKLVYHKSQVNLYISTFRNNRDWPKCYTTKLNKSEKEKYRKIENK